MNFLRVGLQILAGFYFFFAVIGNVITQAILFNLDVSMETLFSTSNLLDVVNMYRI